MIAEGYKAQPGHRKGALEKFGENQAQALESSHSGVIHLIPAEQVVPMPAKCLPGNQSH